ncbi:shikimate dehydrogenase [Nitrososphaera viennensis]|uniref:Shikimate dehydrogenase (NADP(+)) n=2 Tax=Nitrososphaera viennensis TaxID=1034015 RepID=A0A060HDI1_9ARCH|nr:shikimate dehydrogenase [Nitrososphaera viennensis]AIC14779.1 shikimate 5-dehydrogenase [Nitrososphaera viennensis EN76]UVS69734.1 shikimate dehydrogenase [Nitrososphaera viennensis]
MVGERAPAKTYCIIGDPISHSLSPGMQNAAFSALGLNCTYISFRVPAPELKESIDSLRAINVAGFNVTIPHKVAVMEYLDELDATAKKAGAVNTVNNIEGIFKGYNTDIAGFIEPLRRRKFDFCTTVLLLGAGGAARAIIAALSEEKTTGSRVVIANRDQAKAKELAKVGGNLGLQCEAIAFEDATKVSPEAGLIVNATSIGLDNEPSPIDSDHIKKGSFVYDIVYRPVVTDLLEQAKFAQAHLVYGYEMLLEQGAKAFEIWTGLPAPRDVMKKNLLGIFGEPT